MSSWTDCGDCRISYDDACYDECPLCSAQKIVRVGVAVIIQRDDGRVLMGVRKGSHAQGTWAFPGGHVDFGEEPAESARREVREETGLEVGCIDRFAVVPWVNNMFAEGKQYITLYFTAAYQSGVPKVMEPHKCYRWEWVDPNAPDLAPLFDPVYKGRILERLRG
jgi:8-oxo-dGTP diphosphatase